jgi:16S rRNA C967 or C1407 C5-methylase (RsmB/RsmF family)
MQLGFRFDRVLLDAPCTCEGIILKDESRKRSRTLRDLNICSNRQKRMILAGFEALKPGGIMIYSTCSFAPEENEMIIQFLIDRFKNALIEPLNYGSSGLTAFNDIIFSDKMNQTRRFYPHLHDTNGFFIAKIRKSAEPDGV